MHRRVKLKSKLYMIVFAILALSLTGCEIEYAKSAPSSGTTSHSYSTTESSSLDSSYDDDDDYYDDDDYDDYYYDDDDDYDDYYDDDESSWHQCEECSREGIYELTGIAGNAEYYCSEHYDQMMDILDEMISDVLY